MSLSRRVDRLERIFGPAIVSAPAVIRQAPPPSEGDSIPWHERMLQVMEWVEYLKWALESETPVPQIGDVDAIRSQIVRLQRTYSPPLGPFCSTCNDWMRAISIDSDGRGYRCSGCNTLTGFLPYRHCQHPAHVWNQCGYDWTAELRQEWFWLLLNDDAQQAILAMAA